MNVNLQNNDGDTALEVAKYRANQQAIDLLHRHNALCKEVPSTKEQQWDQIYDAFYASDTIKFAVC
jgi:hypothetical protein